MLKAELSSRICTEALPRATTPVDSTTGAAATAAAVVEAGMTGNAHDDSRPRKRAIVRYPRKQKVGLCTQIAVDLTAVGGKRVESSSGSTATFVVGVQQADTAQWMIDETNWVAA